MSEDLGLMDIVRAVGAVVAVAGAVGFGIKYHYWPPKTAEDKWREQCDWGRQTAAELNQEHRAKRKKTP